MDIILKDQFAPPPVCWTKKDSTSTHTTITTTTTQKTRPSSFPPLSLNNQYSNTLKVRGANSKTIVFEPIQLVSSDYHHRSTGAGPPPTLKKGLPARGPLEVPPPPLFSPSNGY